MVSGFFLLPKPGSDPLSLRFKTQCTNLMLRILGVGKHVADSVILSHDGARPSCKVSAHVVKDMANNWHRSLKHKRACRIWPLFECSCNNCYITRAFIGRIMRGLWVLWLSQVCTKPVAHPKHHCIWLCGYLAKDLGDAIDETEGTRKNPMAELWQVIANFNASCRDKGSMSSKLMELPSHENDKFKQSHWLVKVFMAARVTCLALLCCPGCKLGGVAAWHVNATKPCKSRLALTTV